MSTIINHERILWFVGGAVLAQKSGMAGTNKPKLDQHRKTSKPGSLTSGFKTGRNLLKPIDTNYLKA